ncbi:MAG: hypothetical protein P8Z76_19955 [Alphaproteobacteria bacterium]|jgi:hypothetical protein
MNSILLIEKKRGCPFSEHEENIMPRMLWFKPGFIGACIGAIALAVVGFTQLGWVTANTAESMALKSADAAVVKALVPVCVARAQTDPKSGPLLQELDGVNSKWTRRSFVEKAGWAKMPGAESSNSNLADACAQALQDRSAA